MNPECTDLREDYSGKIPVLQTQSREAPLDVSDLATGYHRYSNTSDSELERTIMLIFPGIVEEFFHFDRDQRLYSMMALIAINQ